MKAFAPIGWVLVLVLAPGVVGAGEIERWVDEKGGVHYSNRAPEAAPPDTASPPASGEGWESVLDRQQGLDEFSRRAEAAINGLNVDLRRKKRERDRARSDLEKTQEAILRFQQHGNPTAAYELRPQEAAEILQLQRLENEVARIVASIERAKAIKAMGREQAEREIGQNPFFEYGR